MPHYLSTIKRMSFVGRIFLPFLPALVTVTAHGGDMNSIEDYQWKNRLILVQSAPETNGAAQALRQAQTSIDERDIVWFVDTDEGVDSNQAAISKALEQDVRDLLNKARADDRVLIIGKDGGIKSQEPSLSLDAIFRRIDAMPMRIREMRTD